MPYIPSDCATIVAEQQIRLGLQGYPGTGKTWAALTAPNPVVLNLDRGLGAHIGRKDVIEVPFWNRDFCKKVDLNYKPERLKDALIKWLEKEGSKLEPDQTLVVDGNTGFQSAYNMWYAANMQNFLTKQGQVNDFAEWAQKRIFFDEVMVNLKTLRCNVIYICHEVDQKDKNGPTGPTYSGKVRPLLTGGFGDELASHFTDWFRQICVEKDGKTEYLWQTTGDSIFDAKCGSLVGQPKLVPPNWSTFTTYRRKIS